MSHIENKVEWCLRKAENEIKESGKHRGLIKIKSDITKAREHVKKAEHYLKATIYLKKGDFSDLSASSIFYAMYHCLLAIAVKFGYESRNQECTFALINSLIEEGKIHLKKEMIEKIASFNDDHHDEKTTTEIREQYQYGTELSLKDDLYNELLELAKTILAQTKSTLEE